MGVMERIKEIEAEMARTQKNKATNYHLGTLKAKLAKLRNELFVEESGGSGSSGGEGFEVARNGDARVALIGFPSVGKSTLLGALTTTQSETAAYEFTTLTCIPGVLQYKGSKIQVLDLPGIIEGAAHGAGRGKEVIAVARGADAILIVLDAGKEGLNRHREILEKELETVGIRLNQRPPDVTVTKRMAGGGVRFAIKNLILVIPLEDDLIKQKMWEYLGLTRIYTKRKGSPPDLEEPIVLSEIRKGILVKSLCANISTQMLRDFNYALVWGKSAVHMPQRCGLSHKLDDEDVVQIVTKTIKQQANSSGYAMLAQEYQDKHAKKRLAAKKQKQKRLGG
ncbi:P-loop containing nucleoside triphosphate hydrolase protein [Fragilariopsis cylindrus CCMP1102]|uniref:p-loop containing nucleoside triphosphate hydrolase protein n=1 Tax=Fragilariopsis cylindrus CCMP1102 TaxID=635003 RepID=A0A1E7FFC5_9STRA|nr:P-loop containing nucleoside triphosphate hydrolase protein [Fragilariopsis cylindrus CCMP1102]|eukprot:OEU16847.1 P-loop containing nucleoside triphosphate hydrolase protein [Fragilariopsis cylindrus CCMP1102]